MTTYHRNESVENVCIWLEKNGLAQYCGIFRDYQIDEFMLFTDNTSCEMLCRHMGKEEDRQKFFQARRQLLNMPIEEPQTPEPEVASPNISQQAVRTIVTNNFIRHGGNNQVVMTGGARVVEIPQGDYTAADLSRKWHESNSSDGQPLRPEEVKVVRNVHWRHKSTLDPPDETGVLIFPADFDGNLPSVVATTENLKYYGCSFADGNHMKLTLPMEHSARVYTYNPNYVQEWVLGKSGPGLERHGFTHLDMPHSADNGWFVLGKFNDENETELHLTAFKIPAKQTLVVPPNVIHSNDYLIGEWRTLLADGDIDLVKLKRRRHAGQALQAFAFDFPATHKSSLISTSGDIDVAKLVQTVYSYHALPVPNDCLDTSTRNILTVWGRCAAVAPPRSESKSLDPVFNTITDERLNEKQLIFSLLVDKNFKAHAIDSLKRYHALGDIITMLPQCSDLDLQALGIPENTYNNFSDLQEIVPFVTPRIVLEAVIESLIDDSQRYLGNFIKKNDLPIPISYYRFNTNAKNIEYVINFNLIAETHCLTSNRVLLQMGTSSAIGQGKSSLFPYMCLDKRRTSVNAAGLKSLRTGCVDVLSGIIKSSDAEEQTYILFDVHGTIQQDLNYDLIRAIQHFATIVVFYITYEDLEQDLSQIPSLSTNTHPILVVVFDKEFDGRRPDSKSERISECTNKLKRHLPHTPESSLAVILAPCASLWTQNSENREYFENRRVKLLRDSFSAAFAYLESAMRKNESQLRSCFMIQSLFLDLRSNTAGSATTTTSFAVETQLKNLLQNCTDETDNLLMSTPISYLQGKVRTTEKQLTMHSEEDMMPVSTKQKLFMEQLNTVTSMSAFARFFVELLTTKTFVELLVTEKYLENWRSKYERPLQREMSQVKQDAINWTNQIKRCETELLLIDSQTSPGPEAIQRRTEVDRRLNQAKAEFSSTHQRIGKLEMKLMNVDLTVGLFLDEIMAIADFNPTLLGTGNRLDMIDRLAACFVNLMHRGIAVHILRGRPLSCKSPLLTKTIQTAGINARSPPYVISVIGEQSSAKSSLLNTCFGTNFRVSSGRCTIGIYVSVVHWAALTVVLLDTEGLLSVEEASALFDNQIVTMAMLSSHMTIINHKGEFSTTLSSLIGMSLYAKAQIQTAIKPALLFILRDQADTTNEAKSKHFLPQLTSLKQTLQTDAKFLTTSIDDLMDISPNAVMLLPNALVKDVDSTTGIEQNYRNKIFPTQVQHLRRMIYDSLTASSAQNVYSGFDNMARMLTSNWSVIDNLGPRLLSCKSLVELTRLNELQNLAMEILKPTAVTLNEELETLVEHRLKDLESVTVTMEWMSSTVDSFQTDVGTLLNARTTDALRQFSEKTQKSYFSNDQKEEWKRTITSSLKSQTAEWTHIFEDRLQEGAHVKIIKNVQDGLIATAEARFKQPELPNFEQLRKVMKCEIDGLRRASEQNQRALYEESSQITEKIVRLYTRCLGIHNHERSRQIYSILPNLPITDFMQHAEHLVTVWPDLVNFIQNASDANSLGQRFRRTFGAPTRLDQMWKVLEGKVQWFTSLNASQNRKLLDSILTEVLPKLKEDLSRLIQKAHPIYNKIRIMEEAIDIIDGAMNTPAVTDNTKYLNSTVLVADFAVIALRSLIEESDKLERRNFKVRSEELNTRISSLEQSMDRQISAMADSNKQGSELASTVANALFDEVRRNINVKIIRDIRQAVTGSDDIVHDNVQQLAYASSFVMGNAENILKYVTDINRYFLEVSLTSIRTIFNVVIRDQTAQLEELLCTLLGDINDTVQQNACKNYADVNKIIEKCANRSFLRETKGYTNITFKFPTALPMTIGNSSLFKSSFKCILGYTSKISAEVVKTTNSLRAEAFKECVRAIQAKLGCNERCPGCGAKCAVTTAHDEHIVSRTPSSEFPEPKDANSPVLIHRTKHHLARCLHGARYHSTRQPVLFKCYQAWTTHGTHLNDNEIMKPNSLYYNHRHPSWFENLAEMASSASDRRGNHSEAEQRRGWMLVRDHICHRYQLNDYSKTEYSGFPETYPLVKSLPPDYVIQWNDTSL